MAAGKIRPRRYGSNHSDNTAAPALSVPSHSTLPMPQPCADTASAKVTSNSSHPSARN